MAVGAKPVHKLDVQTTNSFDEIVEICLTLHLGQIMIQIIYKNSSSPGIVRVCAGSA